MILKLKVRNNRKKSIVAWIQKDKKFDESIQQIFQFFKDKIKISKFSTISRYYIISSENPAIILSLFSTIQDLIPDIYFGLESSIKIEDVPSN